MEKGQKSSVKAISLMMIITFAGKVLGLVRDRMLTINYGTGMEANAFLTASRIPRVFFDTIFASAIAASFIPVFNEYMMKKGKKAAFDFSGNFFGVMTLLSLILTVVGMIFSGQLTYFFADGYDPATAALCTALTRIMFPTVLFTGIAYSMVGVLQSLDEFNIPAAISLISNVIVIVYYFTLNDRFGIYGLAITFLIAWLMQALVQIPPLIRKGFRTKITFRFRTDGMKKVFTLMLPVMVSTWVLPINQMINSKFGSRLFEGAGVSAIELSYNLYTVIVGVFVLSVTNFIFPRLSRMNADNEDSAFQETIRSVMHASLYFVLPLMAGMMALAYPLVRFIYGGGEFDQFSVDITSRALIFMSIGMVGYTIQTVLSRAFFAEQNGKTPLIAGLASIAVNLGLCIVLIGPLDVAGLAIASAVASFASAVILVISIQRRGKGFVNRAFFRDLGKMILAAAVMAAVVLLLRNLLTGLVAGKAGELLTLVAPTAAGVVVYFVLTIVLRLNEAGKAVAMVKKIFHKT